MFKKDNRYVTREVNEEVDIRLQLINNKERTKDVQERQ